MFLLRSINSTLSASLEKIKLLLSGPGEHINQHYVRNKGPLVTGQRLKCTRVAGFRAIIFP